MIDGRKAILNTSFLSLFFYESEIDEFNCVEIDEECLDSFIKGSEVEIIKEIPTGQYARNQKSYIIADPMTSCSITVAACFIDFIE